MTEYELVVLTRIITALIALALFGIVCYCFGKSKAEIFPDDNVDNIDEALHEAYLQGYDDGYFDGLGKDQPHKFKTVNRRDEDV